MTTEKKLTIAFFILFVVSSIFFFDVARIDMEDKSEQFPVYMSGEPAEEVLVISEHLKEVEYAACSSSKEGEKIVKEHALGVLKQEADKLGGNGVIDVVVGYGDHDSLKKGCPFGVFVRGTAVVIEDRL